MYNFASIVVKKNSQILDLSANPISCISQKDAELAEQK